MSARRIWGHACAPVVGGDAAAAAAHAWLATASAGAQGPGRWAVSPQTAARCAPYC